MDPSSPPALEDPAFRVFIDSLDYLPPADVERVRAAYAFSARAHANQKRLSGEPYITHPLAVAGAVVEWRMDTEAIMAALLHDVLEDTGATKRELSERFGREVAELVDGLSKLDKMEFASYHEAQAENFRKMLMAMARDLRVVLIKLADRQHNLATMAAVRPDKQRRIAAETLEIYAPIALRLGLNKLYRELQDNCFRLLHPHRAEVVAKALALKEAGVTHLLGLYFAANSVPDLLEQMQLFVELSLDVDHFELDVLECVDTTHHLLGQCDRVLDRLVLFDLFVVVVMFTTGAFLVRIISRVDLFFI